MDKTLIRERFRKAASSYLKNADIQLRVAKKMAVLTEKLIPNNYSERILEIGCGTGGFTRELLKRRTKETVAELYVNDICSGMKDFIPDIAYTNAKEVHFIAGDAEEIEFPYDLGIIASCSAIQWFDSVRMFINKSYNALRPGGFMAISTFGTSNLEEIKRITGKGLAYLSHNELCSIMTEEGFKIHFSDEEIISMKFDSPLDVLKHLRNTGVTGIAREKWTKANLLDFTNKYYEIKKDIELTYNPIYIIAQKQ